MEGSSTQDDRLFEYVYEVNSCFQFNATSICPSLEVDKI